MQVKINVSNRGLIALPATMRKTGGIRPQDTIIPETTLEGILLRSAVTLPLEIYSQIAEFDAAESQVALTFQRGGRHEKT